MTIYRVQHNKNYTVINNTICKDNRLSWKAKGIWLYAFSRPDDWTFYMDDLIKQSIDGKDSVTSGLKELEDCGYLMRIRVRDHNGKLRAAEWTFFETPQPREKCSTDTFEPKPENPILENPILENPPLLSTDVTPNTDENNDDDDRVRERGAFSEKEQPSIQSEADIIITKTNSTQQRYTVSEIYLALLPFNFKTTTIQAAIMRIRHHPTPINNLIKYLESSCRQIETIENNAPKPSSCKTKSKIPVYTHTPPPKEKEKTITGAEYMKKRGIKL